MQRDEHRCGAVSYRVNSEPPSNVEQRKTPRRTPPLNSLARHQEARLSRCGVEQRIRCIFKPQNRKNHIRLGQIGLGQFLRRKGGGVLLRRGKIGAQGQCELRTPSTRQIPIYPWIYSTLFQSPACTNAFPLIYPVTRVSRRHYRFSVGLAS